MHVVESRGSERVRSFLRATIRFNNDNSTVDCVVRNISATGAKIELGNTASVPNEFFLYIPHRNQRSRARIIWRDGGVLGLAFITDESAPTVSEETDAKIARLERDNRRLAATIVDLTKRLEDVGQAVDRYF